MKVWGIKIFFFFFHSSDIQKDVLVLLCGDRGGKVGREILIMRVLNTVELFHLRVMEHSIYICFILVTSTNVVKCISRSTLQKG